MRNLKFALLVLWVRQTFADKRHFDNQVIIKDKQ
jgi:hypothetical protein